MARHRLVAPGQIADSVQLTELDLLQPPDDHRRVLAVLAVLAWLHA
ncbi:MAG: hypothetical protein ACRDZU_09005 [Acidimicrobiales bacterium]